MGTRAVIILNCIFNSLSFTYLRLQIKMSSLTREDWQPPIDRVEKMLATWKGNTLSRGGRLILVNSMLSSLSLYFMAFYYLLEWVIYDIDRIRHAFFWKDNKDIHEGLYLINSQLVCSHKNQGGVRVCNLRVFSALLSKWWWRIFHDIHAP